MDPKNPVILLKAPILGSLGVRGGGRVEGLGFGIRVFVGETMVRGLRLRCKHAWGFDFQDLGYFQRSLCQGLRTV